MYEHFWANVYFAAVAFLGAVFVLWVTSDRFMAFAASLGCNAADETAADAAACAEMTHAERKSKLLSEALAALEKSFPSSGHTP